MHRMLMSRKTVLGRLLVLALLLTFTGGCTTMRPVSMAKGPLNDSIKVGDQVQIRTRDGRVLDIRVEYVDAERIEGGDQSIRIDQIATLERKEFSKLTYGLAVAVFGLLIGALYFSALKEAVSAPVIPPLPVR